MSQMLFKRIGLFLILQLSFYHVFGSYPTGAPQSASVPTTTTRAPPTTGNPTACLAHLGEYYGKSIKCVLYTCNNNREIIENYGPIMTCPLFREACPELNDCKDGPWDYNMGADVSMLYPCECPRCQWWRVRTTISGINTTTTTSTSPPACQIAPSNSPSAVQSTSPPTEIPSVQSIPSTTQTAPKQSASATTTSSSCECSSNYNDACDTNQYCSIYQQNPVCGQCVDIVPTTTTPATTKEYINAKANGAKRHGILVCIVFIMAIFS